MRYYGCVLQASSDEIKEKTKINLREYYFNNILCAMNEFMYRNIKNFLNFFAYQEENGAIFAAFSYHEQKGSFRDACDYIFGMLADYFSVRKVKVEPYEITMLQFLDHLLEGQNRDYVGGVGKNVDASNLWIYQFMSHFGKGEELLPYDFKEKIIPAGNERRHAIYDRSFLNELSNIESHGNALGYKGNTVHYIISGRSVEAAGDMVQTLMQSLFRAKRISSRRMEIISEIEPDIYKKNCQMEKVLENNYGGVVVIDLSEKFGFEPVDYVRTSQYLERLFKKYRNHCLFVFTYT